MGVDILGVDILGVGILRLTRFKREVAGCAPQQLGPNSLIFSFSSGASPAYAQCGHVVHVKSSLVGTIPHFTLSYVGPSLSAIVDGSFRMLCTRQLCFFLYKQFMLQGNWIQQ